ncbi:MAG: hypothetical protein A3E21_08425 [Sulfurimonas sp. RIFCSPHIGHO2_12_FULL_36_9]|uniref:hypothetical protein n=1 Tax=Sulfurimonas sp. RIFCSPLOWO2_12_36_12 TaxID=1802253 RepID=UPI0008D121E2|nr:hypothetical protein [Sulfurimonas sp. RIFCSPLOWO2_12_36_12]OHD98666.1 MAG: hypothetical protein A3E21_08425 [Sulfurimonas sp. RIFCSPHIGHO2_12_FULL_36_9]OHE00770.1 MAG: hypothetical protein A3J26_06835 [Sulfurimonas sp. RIFCSPLOWO2_02_FULL_36_28]OHE02237.1 MAG: hypothetical protein A2W82_01140 [Sulfurimonas sp. RIFCSPLOWO2_12_36_12]OHE04754.1 MAG: hypothetical protein A3K14_04645 [Sulfurimonas sp. RIFCSPLOWO2_12_FULL_36_74]
MKILSIILISVTLYADIKQDMLNLYQNKKHEEVCNIGFNNFENYRNDEEYVSLYAFGCLNADYIDRLSVPTTTLKLSKESRSNAAYFSIILMQKKLLYHALLDNYDLSSLNLPTTDYVLSKVFDLYTKIKKDERKEFYIFEDESDKQLKYKLYILKDGKIDKMVIEEFYNSINIKKHIYW